MFILSFSNYYDSIEKFVETSNRVSFLVHNFKEESRMKVPIRKTIAGTEYWDTEAKRSLFVPKGQEPDFEVTENPKSMLTPEGDKIVVETVVKGDEAIEVNSIDANDVVEIPEEQLSELDNMNAKELRAYAKKNNIEIPAAIRAKGDIIQLIEEAEK